MLSVKTLLPEFFHGVRVLDIGSLDINGNNRYLFTDSSYIGIDLGAGANVDVVCRGHQYKNDQPFDVVISTECFEHDKFWEQTILNGITLLRPGGLFAFTCATIGRDEHGTRKIKPHDSPFTLDYYCNLTEADMREKIHFDNLFISYKFSVDVQAHDLYFWGIKMDNPS